MNISINAIVLSLLIYYTIHYFNFTAVDPVDIFLLLSLILN